MKCIYSKNIDFNTATITIAAEARNLIQNWRKENELPIDFRVPTLKVWYGEDIIGTSLIEGVTEARNSSHIFEMCQIDRVESLSLREAKEEIGSNLDDLIEGGCNFVFWSPLGGTIGSGDILKGTIVTKFKVPDKNGNMKEATKVDDVIGNAISNHFYINR